MAECKIIEDATIHIVAPVLVKGRRFPWKGIYQNTPIEFKVEDKNFLEQVYNHDIKFGNGTAIICQLKIEDKTIVHDDGNSAETKSYYTVKYITHWGDDKNFRYETNRHKKQIQKQNLPQQLSLFGY